MEDYSSSYLCGGQHLIDILQDISGDRSTLCIEDTRPFGDLLSRIEGENLVVLMKVILANVKNPNFHLRNGLFKGKTLLQGAIRSGNKELVQLLLSNTHGSKLSEVIEPFIIDAGTVEWMKCVVESPKSLTFTEWKKEENLFQLEGDNLITKLIDGVSNHCVGELNANGEMITLTPQGLEKCHKYGILVL